jgi:hypothetical protein
LPSIVLTDQVWNNGKKELHCNHVCTYQGVETRRVLQLDVSKITSAGLSQSLVENVVSTVCPSTFSRFCSCASIYANAVQKLPGQNLQWIMTWMNDACVGSSAQPIIPTNVPKPQPQPVFKFRWFGRSRNVLEVPKQHKTHKRNFRAARKGTHSIVRSWVKHSRKSSKAVKLPPKHKYNTLELAELPQNVLVENSLDFDQEFGF